LKKGGVRRREPRDDQRKEDRHEDRGDANPPRDRPLTRSERQRGACRHRAGTLSNWDPV